MSLFDSASLVVTPNGYKEDKLYSIKPTDGSGDLVVTRATTATLVNSAGLIEPAPYNLLQRSQEFENAAWTKSNATITSNAIAAPDGTLTADKLVGSATTSTHIAIQTVSFPVNTVATYSIYAKAGELNFLYLGGLGRTPNANEGYVFFNLSSGTVGVNDTGYSGTISSAGDGWYKLTVSAPLTTSSLSREFRIGVANTNGLQSYTGNGIDGVYIWGAQLVSGTSAKEYFPTTDRLDVPRLDYTNSTCPSILVEPQRTNLATYSEDFSNASWNKVSSQTGTAIPIITANATTAPNGTMTADLVEFTPPTDTNYSIVQKTFTITNLLSGTVYLKAFDESQVGKKVGVYIVKPGDVNGTVLTLTNEWQRVVISRPAGTNIEFHFGKGRTNWTTGGIKQSESASKFYAWGAQLEEGSNATSYIPTVASSVTRNADVISKTGISSLIGQTEGTIFADLNFKNSASKTEVNRIIELTDGTNTNRFIIAFGSTNAILTRVTSSGSEQASFSASVSLGRLKIALSYSASGVKLFVNGALIQSNLSATIPSTSRINLGYQGTTSTQQLNDSINSAVIWKTKLTDAECIALTTI
jgi:hypothetical protein